MHRVFCNMLEARIVSTATAVASLTIQLAEEQMHTLLLLNAKRDISVHTKN